VWEYELFSKNQPERVPGTDRFTPFNDVSPITDYFDKQVLTYTRTLVDRWEQQAVFTGPNISAAPSNTSTYDFTDPSQPDVTYTQGGPQIINSFLYQIWTSGWTPTFNEGYFNRGPVTKGAENLTYTLGGQTLATGSRLRIHVSEPSAWKSAEVVTKVRDLPFTGGVHRNYMTFTERWRNVSHATIEHDRDYTVYIPGGIGGARIYAPVVFSGSYSTEASLDLWPEGPFFKKFNRVYAPGTANTSYRYQIAGSGRAADVSKTLESIGGEPYPRVGPPIQTTVTHTELTEFTDGGAITSSGGGTYTLLSAGSLKVFPIEVLGLCEGSELYVDIRLGTDTKALHIKSVQSKKLLHVIPPPADYLILPMSAFTQTDEFGEADTFNKLWGKFVPGADVAIRVGQKMFSGFANSAIMIIVQDTTGKVVEEVQIADISRDDSTGTLGYFRSTEDTQVGVNITQIDWEYE